MKIILTIFICFFIHCSLLQAQQAQRNIKAGNDLNKQKQYEQAIYEYQKISEQDSFFSIAQFNLGNALYKSGKKDEASKIFNKLLAKENSSQTIVVKPFFLFVVKNEFAFEKVLVFKEIYL